MYKCTSVQDTTKSLFVGNQKELRGGCSPLCTLGLEKDVCISPTNTVGWKISSFPTCGMQLSRMGIHMAILEGQNFVNYNLNMPIHLKMVDFNPYEPINLIK